MRSPGTYRKSKWGFRDVIACDLRWLLAVFVLTGPADAASNKALVLSGEVTVRCETGDKAVSLAVGDLLVDFERVLGKRGRLARTGKPAQIVVKIDPAVGGREQWVRQVTSDGVTISGGDTLGAVYGVYEFARAELGVDPLWFWKDLVPEQRQNIRTGVGRAESTEPIFRYRGWFVNDEDLLTEWREPSGKRFIRYPFYSQVISLEVADRIFEALLRCGGNLVIPASFVDVMNPPEAALVRRAAERGLYVTQHHIEPLGVSHFGFENYWQARGEKKSFIYGDDPESVREVWRAFAEKWVELTGDRVVWQLGLRGKADTAIWNSDKSVSRAEAGRFISRAIAEQWKIVQDVDPRPRPPATTTLWLEGSKLMSEGSLTFPAGVTVVFADEGASQQMQDDFHKTPRQPERDYGVYYHIAFWSRGPHLLQGTTPGRVKNVFDQVIETGDTHYAVVNVCSVREHVLGIQAAMTAMRGPWNPDTFMREWSPPCLHESYRLLMGSFIPIEPDRVLQDGAIFQAIRRHASALREGKPQPAGRPIKDFNEAIGKVNRVIDDYPSEEVPQHMRNFYDVHLLTQAKMWRALLRCIRALKLAGDSPAYLVDAEAALEEFLTVRERAARGRWTNWYRGDKKVNTTSVLELVRSTRKRRLAPKDDE